MKMYFLIPKSLIKMARYNAICYLKPIENLSRKEISMQFNRLTTIEGIATQVNYDNITYVIASEKGALIYFVGGETLWVKEKIKLLPPTVRSSGVGSSGDDIFILEH